MDGLPPARLAIRKSVRVEEDLWKRFPNGCEGWAYHGDAYHGDAYYGDAYHASLHEGLARPRVDREARRGGKINRISQCLRGESLSARRYGWSPAGAPGNQEVRKGRGRPLETFPERVRRMGLPWRRISWRRLLWRRISCVST